MLAVFTNFNCQVTHHHTDKYEEENQRDFFLQLVFVSLAHFCNLSALNYCIKSMLATISAIVIVILFSTWSCDPCTHQEKPIMMANSEASTVSITCRNLKKMYFFKASSPDFLKGRNQYLFLVRHRIQKIIARRD